MPTSFAQSKWRFTLYSGLVLLGIFLGGAYVLPKKYHLERSVVIEAPAAEVFVYLNNLRRWPEWMAWYAAADTTLSAEYEGPETGVGAQQSWQGKKLGSGSVRISRSIDNQLVEYDAHLKSGAIVTHGKLQLTPQGTGTQVTWIDEGDLGYNPFARYFGVMLDGLVGHDLAKGLSNLQQKITPPAHTNDSPALPH